MSQRRNMMRGQQQQRMFELQRKEEQREQHAIRVGKEKELQASLMLEERFEKKRHLRKVQDELHEKQLGDALLKVT